LENENNIYQLKCVMIQICWREIWN